MRLRVICSCCNNSRLIGFQFLLVRLRGNLLWFRSPHRYLFQFLLVRLRERDDNCRWRVWSISIPSGAIKRMPTDREGTSSCQISIPSGAIKSRVQVKRNIGTYYISIPSGAIKRFQKRIAWIASYIFQFLLVRLRDTRQDNYSTFNTFQFLLVRLRVFLF